MTPIDLSPRYVHGETFTVSRTTSTKTTGPQGEQHVTLTVDDRFTITNGGALGDGAVAWTDTLLRINVAGQAGDAFAWDSSTGAPPPPGLEGLPLLVGLTTQVKIDKGLDATVTWNADALKARVQAVGPTAAVGLFQILLNDHVSNKIVSASLHGLPTQFGAVGEKVSSPSVLPVGGIGQVATVDTWTLDAVNAGQATLSQVVIAASPGAQGPNHALLLELGGSGSAVFDVARGRLVSQSGDTHLAETLDGAPVSIDTHTSVIVTEGP